MGNAKFTFNAFVLIVILVTGIAFFFTVVMVDFATRPALNEYYPIEGSNAAVCYRSQEPSGIYVGDRATGVLKLEGEFGFDWGLVREGQTLYTNEYSHTSLGLLLCQVVRIDLDSFEKEVLLKDAILRGRCASGELVCLGGAMLPSAQPQTNSLCKLYCMAAPGIDPDGSQAQVIYLDPASGEELLRLEDASFGNKFEELYLQRPMQGVAK